jgi:hypothetical protein
MARTETYLPGLDTRILQDDATGILIQMPDSTKQTMGGLDASPPVTGQKFYGVPLVLGCRVGIAANSPAASTTYRATILNKNAPTILKILKIETRMVDITEGDFTTGDGGNLTLTVKRGNGAASETESDVLAEQQIDGTVQNGEQLQYPTATVFLTNDTIVSGGSLYVDLLVDPDVTAGAVNDGCTYDVWVTCVPVV